MSHLDRARLERMTIARDAAIRERDEARNAMHRREEEVVAARCERDEARAQLADVAARQRLDTAGAACAALTDLAYGAEEAVHVRDVLMARPLVTDDARDLTRSGRTPEGLRTVVLHSLRALRRP